MCRRLMWFLGCGALVAAMVLSLAMPVAGDEPVQIQISPSVCHSPCALRVTVRMPLDPTLRGLMVELDSPALFRSSSIDLDGANSPRAHVLEFHSLPAGTYEVRAVLTREADDRSVERVVLSVVDPDARPATGFDADP
jgi:hypothetical protein